MGKWDNLVSNLGGVNYLFGGYPFTSTPEDLEEDIDDMITKSTYKNWWSNKLLGVSATGQVKVKADYANLQGQMQSELAKKSDAEINALFALIPENAGAGAVTKQQKIDKIKENIAATASNVFDVVYQLPCGQILVKVK